MYILLVFEICLLQWLRYSIDSFVSHLGHDKQKLYKFNVSGKVVNDFLIASNQSQVIKILVLIQEIKDTATRQRAYTSIADSIGDFGK